MRLAWVIIGLLLIGAFLSSEGSRSYWKRKRHFKHLEQKLSELKVSNDNLAREVQRLKSDPRALERIARSELGLQKPGEIEYRFTVGRSTGKNP
ncbi:MAG: hypothetical protein A3A86_04100 [Elusimicrobia bacterium RIFCSPLOWO2_01_FULL_60_11]|nr:MAG: hypothetical protein A3A86_04100 [Elusimicrobia bacterium RIFCSPLOWO2_01_FULL_60_11]